MDAFRFLFMTDCQLGCYATFSGTTPRDVERFAERGMRVEVVPPVTGFEWDARRYEQAVAAARQLRPELVVMGGDMIDDARSGEQLAELRRITAGLDDIPIHWVPGNHDAATDTVVPTADSLDHYRREFGPDHYAIEQGGVALIVTNTVVWDHPEHVPDECDRQLDFLETELREARRRRDRHVLVFGHHPLFTRHPDEPDSYWNVPLERRRAILDLLAAHDVRAFFCGHWHRNGGGVHEGLEVVVSGPVGYPLGDDPSGLRIVEVTADAVEHRYVALDDLASASRRAEDVPA